MGLDGLRGLIDEIDDKIVRLFSERMRVSADIARFKAKSGMAVHDPERERQKLADVLSKTDKDLHEYMEALYKRIFELSRKLQEETK
jgi:chorismate mutase/prephenate dehydratase